MCVCVKEEKSSDGDLITGETEGSDEAAPTAESSTEQRAEDDGGGFNQTAGLLLQGLHLRRLQSSGTERMRGHPGQHGHGRPQGRTHGRGARQQTGHRERTGLAAKGAGKNCEPLSRVKI